jgi:hypothetical protein
MSAWVRSPTAQILFVFPGSCSERAFRELNDHLVESPNESLVRSEYDGAYLVPVRVGPWQAL